MQKDERLSQYTIECAEEKVKILFNIFLPFIPHQLRYVYLGILQDVEKTRGMETFQIQWLEP